MSRETFNKLIQVVVKERLALERNPEVRQFIEEREALRGQVHHDRRQAARMEVELQAVVMLYNEGNEFVCLPALIRNISLSGALLEIADKGHFYVSTLERVERFVISFFVPGQESPVAIECEPKRLEVNCLVEVGAQFFRSRTPLQRFLM